MQRNVAMNSRLRCLASVLALSTHAEIVIAGPFNLNKPTITVSPARAVSIESTKLLTEIAQPTFVEMAKGDNGFEKVRARCGVVSKDYLAILQKANPGTSLKKLKEDTRVSVPACFVVDPEKKVVVESGDSLAILANRYFGSEGVGTISRIVKANGSVLKCSSAPAMSQPSSLDDCVLKPGQKLVLPNVPITASYQMRASADIIAERQDQLSSSLQKDAQGIGRSGVLSVEDELIASTETDLPPEDQCREGESTEPYPRSQLLKVLGGNDDARARAQQDGETITSKPSVLVVADTGLSGFGTAAFPKSTFYTTTYTTNGRYRNYGRNMYDDRAPTEWKNYKKYGHGTQVAGLARGGVNLTANEAQVFSGRVKLLIAAVLRVNQQFGVGEAQYYFSTPAGGILSATNYAASQHADVLNISYTSKALIFGLDSAIKQDRGLLVVASAGNAKENTDFFSDVFPHNYGGVGTDNFTPHQVITVAAHQRNGELAPFSSYGKQNVDLAAPGCRVQSNSVAGGAIPFSGTSVAAPIVSFAAALLRSEGLLDARHVKARIIFGLDRTTYLEKRVAWGGKLNIVKALSVYYDVLQLKSSPELLLFGRIDLDSNNRLLCEGTVTTVNKFSKIYRNSDVANDGLHAMRKGSGGYVKNKLEDCRPEHLSFKFHVSGEAAARTIDWADVLDFVPRYYDFDSQ